MLIATLFRAIFFLHFDVLIMQTIHLRCLFKTARYALPVVKKMDLSECENVGTLGTLNDSSLESSLLERKKKRVSSSTAFRKLFLFLLGIRAPALVLIFSALISMIASYVNSAAIAGAMLAIENHNPLALFLLLGGAAAFAFLAVFSPLAGWVVDSLCGRYRGVKCSLWLLSLPTLAASVVLLAIVGVPSDPQGTLDVNNAGYVVLISAAAIGATPLAFGLLVFKSSVVQFGTDQLTDLTPLSCSLFVHGLLWTESVGRALPELYIGTLYPASLPISGWLQLFYALSFTLLLVVLLECCFHRCLAKEIKIPNPYRLLWIVFRSSLLSRERRGIESAKLDFGGTCSEVEVKRLQIVLAVTRMTSVFAAAGGLSICSSAALPLLARIMQDGGGVLSLPGCPNGTNCSYQSATLLFFGSGNFSTILLVLCTPLLCPLLAKCGGTFKFAILKFGTGLALLMVSILCSFLVDVIGRAQLPDETTSQVCLLMVHSANFTATLAPPVQLTALQDVLNALSYLLTFTSSVEFILLESPRYMKGMLLCIFYSLQGGCALLGIIVALLFSLHAEQVPSCDFWYFAVNLAVSVLVMGLLIVCAKRYKPCAEMNIIFPDTDFVTSFEQTEIDQELGIYRCN